MKMVDIERKETTKREAVVEGKIFLSSSVINAINKGKVPKGDVLKTAKIAGILAAKKTSHLIPLCHPILINYIDIEFFIGEKEIRIRARVKGESKTGVEIEAFTATAVAALTIYDMCKSLDPEMIISDIKLMLKKGGKGGTFSRNEK